MQRNLEQIKLMLDNIAGNLDVLSQNRGDEIETGDLGEVNALLEVVNKEYSSNAEKVSDEFRDAVTAYLEKRWARVRNTAKCYTTNQQYIFNIISIMLAECLDADTKNSLLMPGVKEEDTNLVNINELKLGEFIVSDDGLWFVLVDEIIEEACSRIIEQEEPLFVNKNKAQHLCGLSAAEISRLGNLAPTINAIAAWYRARTANLLSELADLRDSLLRGQVGNGGEEMNAGSDANVGIAAFHAIYSLLSEDEKHRLRAVGDDARTIGNLLDILFRESNQNYREVTFCIKLLGQRLANILAYRDNAETLSGMSVAARHRLTNLVKLVKSQFNTKELIANDDPLSRTSRLNPDMQFDEGNWVISLIAPRTNNFIPVTTKIIVEGLVDGQLFVGSYYPIAKPGSTWPIVPDVIQNTGGVFSKIKIFESSGYRQVPLQGSDGQVDINDTGEIAFKFDLVNELRCSLARSHIVSAESAKTMIEAMKAEARKTDIANWVSPLDGAAHPPTAVDAVMSNPARYTLFTPYERFGNKSVVGTGKHNCVTWCEEKLALAGCGRSSVLDYGKGKPSTHTIKRFL